MTVPAERVSVPRTRALIRGSLWQATVAGSDAIVSVRGHPFGDISNALAGLTQLDGPAAADALCKLLQPLRGNFAVLVETADWVLAATDHVRSIPLYCARSQGHWEFGDDPTRILSAAGLTTSEIDPIAHLSIAMGGCTVGQRTLYRGLDMLLPGEVALLPRNGAAARQRYYIYRPWRVIDRPGQSLEQGCKEVLLDVFERMFATIGGRRLVVPLSAGYDSRLIVAMAKHFGHKDVLCFTYGRAGNFEAETSRAICDRLDIPWKFVPLDTRVMRDFYASDLRRSYETFAETAASTPFIQDVKPLQLLLDSGVLSRDDVIVNGQSGDYITGNHVPAVLQTPVPGANAGERKSRILAAYAKKHFSLWQILRTADNLRFATDEVWQEVVDAGGKLGAPDCDHGLYEVAEFQDRQSKYVISGQRCYDMLGLDWRLPLWDCTFMEFWEGVPASSKADQRLYADVLRSANFGDVWHDLPVNKKTIRPRALVPIRLAAKAVTAPFGKERWHATEQRWFQYWMELTCNTTAVPYSTWVLDTRGARNTLSWLTEMYLARHGLTLVPSSC